MYRGNHKKKLSLNMNKDLFGTHLMDADRRKNPAKEFSPNRAGRTLRAMESKPLSKVHQRNYSVHHEDKKDHSTLSQAPDLGIMGQVTRQEEESDPSIITGRLPRVNSTHQLDSGLVPNSTRAIMPLTARQDSVFSQIRGEDGQMYLKKNIKNI